MNTTSHVIAGCLLSENRAEDVESRKLVQGRNQDGGVGRHTVPPRTTRTDRESNSKGD